MTVPSWVYAPVCGSVLTMVRLSGASGDRNLGVLQQELPVQGPFEPAAHLRGVLFGGRLVAGETGLQDPLTDEDAQARHGPGSALGHDDHSPLSALTS